MKNKLTVYISILNISIGGLHTPDEKVSQVSPNPCKTQLIRKIVKPFSCRVQIIPSAVRESKCLSVKLGINNIALPLNPSIWCRCYGLRGFKGCPQLFSHDAERRQSLGQIHLIGDTFQPDFSSFKLPAENRYERTSTRLEFWSYVHYFPPSEISPLGFGLWPRWVPVKVRIGA